MKVKSNLDEILYHKVIESLIRGEYAVGQKILLDELCEKFEVSRTPVVQAVKMLNKDGILTIMGNGRIYVPEYQYDMVRQICEVRSLIEVHGLEKIMMEEKEAVFYEKYSKIKKLADECKLYCEQKKFVEMAMADLQFHRAIVEGAGNKILEDLYTGVQGRFIISNYLIHPLTERNYQKTIQDHFELMEWIEQRKCAKALKKLQNHISAIAAKFSEEI